MVVNLDVLKPYRPLWEEEGRYYLVWGGRRSGKSWAVTQRLIVEALQGAQILALRKYRETTRLSIYRQVAETCAGIGIPYKKLMTQLAVRIGGGEIICGGVDEPEKLKSLSDIDYVWLEEATEFSEQDFLTIDVGLSKQGSKIFLTYNPVPLTHGGRHWLQELQQRDNAVVVHTTYKDNPYLPDQVVGVIEELSGSLYRLWAHGEWVEAEGVILTNWDVVQSVPDDAERVAVGLDWGYLNETAAVRVWRRGRELWVQEEVYTPGLSMDDLAYALRYVKNWLIVADSAEPRSIEELRRRGYRVVPASKGRGSVIEGIRELQSYRIHVVKSPNIERELSSWSWRRDRHGNVLPVPEDANNHAIDAIRYALTSGSSVRISIL